MILVFFTSVIAVEARHRPAVLNPVTRVWQPAKTEWGTDTVRACGCVCSRYSRRFDSTFSDYKGPPLATVANDGPTTAETVARKHEKVEEVLNEVAVGSAAYPDSDLGPVQASGPSPQMKPGMYAWNSHVEDFSVTEESKHAACNAPGSQSAQPNVARRSPTARIALSLESSIGDSPSTLHQKCQVCQFYASTFFEVRTDLRIHRARGV